MKVNSVGLYYVDQYGYSTFTPWSSVRFIFSTNNQVRIVFNGNAQSDDYFDGTPEDVEQIADALGESDKKSNATVADHKNIVKLLEALGKK